MVIIKKGMNILVEFRDSSSSDKLLHKRGKVVAEIDDEESDQEEGDVVDWLVRMSDGELVTMSTQDIELWLQYEKSYQQRLTQNTILGNVIQERMKDKNNN